MPSENPTFNNKEGKETKKGVALKSLIALTHGILNKNVNVAKKEGDFIAMIEKTKTTYRSLDELEKEIDPTGELSGKIEERLVSGFDKLLSLFKEKE